MFYEARRLVDKNVSSLARHAWVSSGKSSLSMLHSREQVHAPGVQTHLLASIHLNDLLVTGAHLEAMIDNRSERELWTIAGNQGVKVVGRHKGKTAQCEEWYTASEFWIWNYY